MLNTIKQKLTRIGVFYDGSFFYYVSNYYNYHHPRQARISVMGLHEFIRYSVAEQEKTDVKYCQIVDAHYFRGRLKAQDASETQLRNELIFDEILVREGVTTHYLPLTPDGEKGIDVWFALEAYELAIYKQFDVSVLVACDGDFLPLVRKLNTLGTRVMLLGWDFTVTDYTGRQRETKTAQVLLNEVTYPIMMDQVIDDPAHKRNPVINGLFVTSRDAALKSPYLYTENGATGANTGRIQNLLEGYGFITPDDNKGKNLFFYHAEVVNGDFNELERGDRVTYEMGQNDTGECAINVRKV